MIKRFFKFLLRTVLWFVFIGALFAVIAAFTMGPDVKENSVLVMDLSGSLPEEGPQNWKERLLVGEMLTTNGVMQALKKAQTDPRIKALIVNSTYSYMGPGKAQEIRSAVKNFASASKKPVFGFLEDGGTIDYYLCSAAPRMFMPPDSDTWFTLIGIRAEIPFFKGTMEKLDVQAQIDHIGTYKSGSETYTRDSMSDSDREQTSELLESLFDRMTKDIALDRKLDHSQVRELVNQSPLVTQELKNKGLVNDLLYRDQLFDLIKKELKLEEINSISALEYQKPTFQEALDEKPDRIGLIYATGTIMPGESYKGFGENFVGATTVANSLRHARDDEAVKAVVFRIDSPGGSPSASDVIWREVKVTAGKKPVVVSMGDVAASGGYYIAMAGTKILADPSSITGSIGVYGGKFYLKGLYEKIGITKDIVKKGEHADLFSDYVPFEDEEWAIIRKHMQHTYDAFTRKAAEGRKRTQQQIHEIAQGRVWSGDQALKIGLIDRLGGLMEAVDEAKNLAKLQDFSITVYPSSRQGGLGEMITQEKGVQLPGDFNRLYHLATILEKEPVLLLMPYRFLVN